MGRDHVTPVCCTISLDPIEFSEIARKTCLYRETSVLLTISNAAPDGYMHVGHFFIYEKPLHLATL